MGRLFGTDGVRDRANQGNMTTDLAMRIGRAIGLFFAGEGASDEVRPTIVVGRDTRLSGSMLEAAVAAGICSAGVDVRLLGVVPTPAVAYLTVQTGAVAGVVVSASHNPYYDNGIKVFKGDGFKLDDDEEDRLERLCVSDAGALPLDADVGTVFALENATERYSDFCEGIPGIDRPLEGLKLVLDCSNGATSYCAEAVFSRLGADVVAIHNEPDGININDNCGSQHTEDLRRTVLDAGADAGLAFDGDGDRLIAVDEKGRELTGDQIMAICAMAMKEQGILAGNKVVATVMSNVGFHAAMKAANVETLTTGVGDRQVVAAMRDAGAVLGGEDSGHMVFLDCHTTGDGIVSGIRLMDVLKRSGSTLSTLAQAMVPFPQRLINVTVASKPPIESVPAIRSAVAEAEAQLADKGRILIRYSGTQPMCRVMVEGSTEQETNAVAERLARVVQEALA